MLFSLHILTKQLVKRSCTLQLYDLFLLMVSATALVRTIEQMERSMIVELICILRICNYPLFWNRTLTVIHLVAWSQLLSHAVGATGTHEEEHRLRQECSGINHLNHTVPGTQAHYLACSQLSSLQVS